MEEIKIENYRPEFAADFKKLNVEWLEKYFKVEERDEEQLDNPEEILEKGGHIFFAQFEGKNVGTASLIHEEPGVYELAKMAVTERAKGYASAISSWSTASRRHKN